MNVCVTLGPLGKLEMVVVRGTSKRMAVGAVPLVGLPPETPTHSDAGNAFLPRDLTRVHDPTRPTNTVTLINRGVVTITASLEKSSSLHVY